VARLLALGSLVATAWTFGPHVVDAVRIFGIRNDPAGLLSRMAASSQPQELRQRAEQALDENDPELAASLSLVATENGAPFPPDLQTKIGEASRFSLTRSAGEIWKGALTGRADTPTAFAAAMAADLTVVGDARDLSFEIARYPDQDNLTMFLAAAGIAMTANTVLTQGAALPVKGGISVLKAARKLNKLPKSLEEDMVKVARRSVDEDVLAAIRRRAGDFDVKGAIRDGSKLLRPDAIKAIEEAAGAVSTVATKQGYRATMQTLENAGEMSDLPKLGAAAEKLGPKYRGTLVLRKGAQLSLKITAILLKMIWILAGAAIWVACAIWTVLSFARGVGRFTSMLARRTVT
jgi:hypothetical protein